MSEKDPAVTEKYNAWTVVNVVFRHLADAGLHPVLGESGDPSAAAEELLRSLGITPGHPAIGDGQDAQRVQDELALIRAQFVPADPPPPSAGSGG